MLNQSRELINLLKDRGITIRIMSRHLSVSRDAIYRVLANPRVKRSRVKSLMIEFLTDRECELMGWVKSGVCDAHHLLRKGESLVVAFRDLEERIEKVESER